jgi:integrase
MHAIVLSDALEQYILYRDLSRETAAWYRRICSVFIGWAGSDVLVAEFNGEAISRLILAKQQAGRSSYYLRSLRNGLVALLREIRGDAPMERIRTVKTRPLDPQAWTAGEVELLLLSCQEMPPASRWRWQLIIAMAYYTGLDRCDLEKLTRENIGLDGVIYTTRSKTGAPVVVRVPPDVLAMINQYCPTVGPILRMGITPEWFRRIFNGIVARAKLAGTFKKFRKTSGSLVEFERPGMGCKHLGNTPEIFRKHYEARKITRQEPTMPPLIRLTPPPSDPRAA